ncbi:MAG: SGNH/GDSL hydrolase family protein [Clostridia bacterium]|nr:SGNH/GDSL hydrolase family protein [Clostridia bacterium]
MKKILFQGDSITDAGRNRENDLFRGSGYATLVSASLGYKYPEEYEFVNRGISGVGVANLLMRSIPDFISLAPDYVSILIGVNDALYETRERGGIDVERFSAVYRILLDEVKKYLPEVKIILMTPFILKGSATEESFEGYRSSVEKAVYAVKKIAKDYSLPVVSLLEVFDEFSMKYKNDSLLYDGVHPTAMGHEIIKNEWLKAFEKIKE